MKRTVVEREYDGAGNAQQDRRVGDDDELGAFFGAVIYLHQQCQLSLRR